MTSRAKFPELWLRYVNDDAQVMVNSLYPWQLDDWRQIEAYFKQGRIPQALLLTGAAGLGKRRLAECFAQALLCHASTPDHPICGECPGCQLFQAQTHPDYFWVGPDEPGKAIGIDKIRQLIVTLSLKPQGPARRIAILSPAEQLNTPSANAFLKCLEEPGERTSFVLISEMPSRLPATIRSRCQTLVCRRPDAQTVGAWLQQQGFNECTDTLLSLCDGSPLKARQYAEFGIMAVYRDCFAEWLSVAKGKQNVVTLVEKWLKLEQLPSTEILVWLLKWLIDLIKLKTAAERDLPDTDYKKALQGVAERLELHGLYRYYDEVLKARQLLATQVNKQLLFEQLLIGWLQLHRS